MKKWLGLFLALGLIVGLMAACGPNEESSGNGGDSGESSGEGDGQNTESEGSSEEQPKPDKLIVWEDQDKGKALEAAAKKFTDETGIEIEYVNKA